ncbi:membrane integrity-associated transporter subunit PqiC [Brenneria izadpanahii]|uniref:Membrane integrity-associated transporter subunit PqiC n=1 Tax=Brenneria izadpanahii TaxID=2722756 RepID=A0ABX7USA0_9GAMM|nr:PqiC family protein [Brenneria izadpanahii]QTF08624.1 membrane integrity-associated transporter subunit PqiC [Brenneria izadpanahii]
MKLSFRALVIGAVLSLSACASPQVRYHTLVSPEPFVDAATPVPFVIEVLPVGVPAQLDTQQVIVRQGDSRVAVLNNDRWLSPLGDELQTALSSQIARRLGTQDASGLPRDDGKPVVRILIQIRRFDGSPGNGVALDADWSLSARRGQQRSRLLCRSHLTQSAAGDYTQLFTAWQSLMGRMATQIAQTAAQWSADGAEACPH